MSVFSIQIFKPIVVHNKQHSLSIFFVSYFLFKVSVGCLSFFPAVDVCLDRGADALHGEAGLQSANSRCAVSLGIVTHSMLRFTLIYTPRTRFLASATQ